MAPKLKPKKSILKRFWDLLFKPRMDLYGHDEPTKSKAPERVKTKKKNPTSVAAKGPKAKKAKGAKADWGSLSPEEQGERLGFIDKAGVVRLKATRQEVGRVGQAKSLSPDEQRQVLGSYIERYQGLATRVKTLVAKSQALSVQDSEDIESLSQDLKTSPGLGDSVKLLNLLEGVEAKAKANMAKFRAEKIKILQAMDALPKLSKSGAPEWADAKIYMERLRQEWQAAPKLEKAAQSALDERYAVTLAGFDERLRLFHEDVDANAQAKRKLVNQAEALLKLDESDKARQGFAKILFKWNAIGPASAEDEAVLGKALSAVQQNLQGWVDEADAREQRRFANLLQRKSEMRADLEKLKTRGSAQELRREIARHRAVLDQVEAVLGQDDETAAARAVLAAQNLRADQIEAEKAKNKQKELARLEELKPRIEALTRANGLGLSWQAADKELQNLSQEVLAFKHQDRQTKAVLSQEIKAARKALSLNRAVYFEEMDQNRTENADRKRALINDLPFYKTGATANELTEHLQKSLAAWKAIGSAGRDLNEPLWQEYNGVRQDLFGRVEELREIEKDEFSDRLAAAFAHKKELASKLEREIQQDQHGLTVLEDAAKVAKLEAVIKRKEKRFAELQNDLMSIQRKLAKLSAAKKAKAEMPSNDATPEPSLLSEDAQTQETAGPTTANHNTESK